MTCQGGTWVRITESDTSGNLGVRQAAPKAPLHVGGEAIIGSTTGLACDADRTGGVRYSTANDCLEYCDGGGSWTCIAPSACADTTPASFSFTNLTSQSASSQVTSNIEQITGLGCAVNVSISGQGSPQYRTCSDSGCSTVVQDWTNSTVQIANNDYLQLRLTTSATGGETYTATVTAGNGADTWSATTSGDCTGSPTPGTVCSDGTIYAGQSPDGNVKMYTTRCDEGENWDGSGCTGVRVRVPWNDGNSSNFVSVSTNDFTDSKLIISILSGSVSTMA